jgi:DNA repair protein RadD
MGSEIILREDQLEAVSNLRTALKDHQSVLFQAQTGFGKTVVASYMAMNAHQKRKRVIFGVHRKELLRQTSRTFSRFGIPHGFIAAGLPANPFALVQIASADTLKSRRHMLSCDLFVPDEARLWATKTREGMIAEAKAAGAHIVGLDATPERLDGRPLSGLFDAMVSGPSVEWLMENGHLSQYRAFAPKRPDMSGLHSRAGDYMTSELEERFNKPSIIGDAIQTQRKYASGLRTMVFAFSRKHGKDLRAAYNANGISAVYIDGDTPSAERTNAVRLFADGEAECLISVGLCTEGFDLSAQVGRDVPVEAISLQRPTQSKPLALQMLGRSLRPKARPAIIMDHVNLLAMHGLPDDHREWSLEGRPKGSGAGEAAISAMTCMSCFGVYRPFLVCPGCGAAREAEGRQVEEIEGDIEEVDIEAIRKTRKAEERIARTLPEMVALGRSRGYKNPEYWAHMRMTYRQKVAGKFKGYA